MQFKKINIADLCNHKLFYDSVPDLSKNFGLENICGLKEKLSWMEEEIINGVEFRLNFGTFDNIQCSNQEILVTTRADKLHILGFAYWGDTKEIFTIKYADGTEELIYVPFIDWSHPFGGVISEIEFADVQVKTAKQTWAFGALEHPIFIHHSVSALNGSKEIEKIVLPQNMFIHIFAVTLENN